MKYLVIRYLLSVAILFSGTLIACKERQGSLENAGERLDEIVDNAKDGDPLLHKKGPMEKAGEAVDEAFDGKK